MNPEIARSIVYDAWKDRQAVVLCTDGWHTCGRSCKMQKLRAYACIDGKHAIPTSTCHIHPHAKPVLVNDLFVCTATGKPHVCNTDKCQLEHGMCVITGQPVVCHVRAATHSQRRCRRKKTCVYNNEQIARAFVYDLLFSNRRIEYEKGRFEACFDMSRRTAQRYVRELSRQNKPMFIEDIMNVFTQNKQKLRSMEYLNEFPDMQSKEKKCRYYANIVMKYWTAISPKMPTTINFEVVVSAILYMMRRGVAYDGIYVMRPDRFLHKSLPDAHAIKEVGVHRRQFTQTKNSISRTIREIIDSGEMSATDIADTCVTI